MMLLLGMYPEYQQRVYDELDTIDLSDGTNVSSNDIGKLSYLDMVIHETLRVCPATPYLTRTVTSEMQLGKVNIV